MFATEDAKAKSFIAHTIDLIHTSYTRPVVQRVLDDINECVRHLADYYCFDATNLYEDLRDAMFRRGRTGERVFRGVAY